MTEWTAGQRKRRVAAEAGHCKVLGCPEDPLPRHAIALAEIVSRAVAGEGSIIKLVVTVAAEWGEA
jgi:hypothetical protein